MSTGSKRRRLIPFIKVTLLVVCLSLAAGGPEESRRLRDLLRASMEAEGFSVYEPEWWHYDFKDWREYPILDLSFSEVKRRSKKQNPRSSKTSPKRSRKSRP